jgi:hypothetical protein
VTLTAPMMIVARIRLTGVGAQGETDSEVVDA